MRHGFGVPWWPVLEKEHALFFSSCLLGQKKNIQDFIRHLTEMALQEEGHG